MGQVMFSYSERKVCALLQPNFPNNQKVEQPVEVETKEVVEVKPMLFKEKPKERKDERKRS